MSEGDRKSELRRKRKDKIVYYISKLLPKSQPSLKTTNQPGIQ